MKIALGILLLTVLVLASLLGVEIMTNREQHDQIQKLRFELADKSKQSNLELQAKCAMQAEKMYQHLGYKLSGPDVYQSHYNEKLNKCFMLIETTRVAGESISNGKYLFDAYEQREYANYIWMTHPGKKYWEVPPAVCELIPSTGAKTDCKSEDEYKDFVARYME